MALREIRYIEIYMQEVQHWDFSQIDQEVDDPAEIFENALEKNKASHEGLRRITIAEYERRFFPVDKDVTGLHKLILELKSSDVSLG